MANRLLSISLGSGIAKIAEIVPNGRKVSVYSAYNVELPDGLCDDGIVLNAESLAEELKAFITGHGITSKKLVFVIGSKRIATKEVVIPFVKEKQIQGIIQMNAPEYFPVSNIEEYALNYSILEIVQAETKQYRLSVTATPNELLKGYVDLAKLMKMPIEVMDHAGNAILQVLRNQALSTEVVAILQLGRENTVINIMSSGILVMQRSVLYGLDAVLAAVRDAFRLSDSEAYDFVEDNDINRICQAYPDVSDIVSTMMSSIGRIFEFYNSRAGEHQISAVKFTGDGTIINGIGTVIEQSLQVPTSEIMRLYNVDVKGRHGITPEQATNFISNIGAVLKPVRLKYTAAISEGEKEGDGKLPIWMIVVAFAAAVIMVASSFGLYYYTKLKVDSLKRQAEALAPMRNLETQLNDAIALTNAVDGFYQSTKGPNDSIRRLISDLESVIPSGTFANSFSVDAGGSVVMNCEGLGKKSVAKIITELKNLKYVSNVRISGISESEDDTGKVESYVIYFTIADIHAIEFEEQQAAENAQDAEDIDIEVFDEEQFEEDNVQQEESMEETGEGEEGQDENAEDSGETSEEGETASGDVEGESAESTEEGGEQ